MKINIPEERVSFLVSIFLALILFISSLFLIYANEIILDKNEKKSQIQEKIYYNKFYFWDMVEKLSDYKNSIVIDSDDSENTSKWLARIIWFIWLWFSISLFMLQLLNWKKEKETIIKYSFFYTFVWLIIFIIFMKIYLFFLSGWFNLNFSKFFEKWNNWLSYFDKSFIIFLIIALFMFVWMIYWKLNKKEN